MPPRPRYPITVPDRNGDFRASHSARSLQREAEEGFDLDEYRRRAGADPFAQSLHNPQSGTSRYDPYAAIGTRAEFGKPTDESTLTWGNSALLVLPTVALGHFVPVVTTQLISLARRRPTSYNILTVIALGAGWTYEGTWTVTINYLIGVGQTKAGFPKVITIATPADNTQIFNTDVFPASSINSNCVVSIATSPALTNTKQITITQMCAPVFE